MNSLVSVLLYDSFQSQGLRCQPLSLKHTRLNGQRATCGTHVVDSHSFYSSLLLAISVSWQAEPNPALSLATGVGKISGLPAVSREEIA